MTKGVTDTSEKSLEEIQSTTKAVEETNESNVHVKAIELMTKNGVSDSSLIRPPANVLNLLVRQNKSHFDCMMILIVIVGMIS